MRSGLDATTLALYLSGEYTIHTKFFVENGSGTLIALQGRVSELSGDLPNPAEPIGKLQVTLYRENTKEGMATSLSPLIAASSYNELNDNVTYSPLLQLGRLVVAYSALTAIGGARPADGSSFWYETFRGYITNVDWPQYDTNLVTISCNDLAGILELAKSEAEYTYVAGTSLEDVASQILTNNGFGTVPVDFAAPTGKVLPNDYEPGLQKTVWSQLWALAQSMGWVVYYRYTGQNDLALTFFEPAREKTVPDMTVTHWWDFSQMNISEEEVRNVGYVQFYDENGTPLIEGPLVNTDSIIKYGGSAQIRRPFWIALTEDSPIRSLSEAQQLLQAALSDVSDPDAIATHESYPLIFAEPGVDLYTYPERDRLFDSDQTFAPFRVSYRLLPALNSVGTAQVRGVPTAGMGTWRSLNAVFGDTVVDEEAAYRLRNWRFTYDYEAGTVLTRWERGPLVYEVWVYDTLHIEPEIPDNPWPEAGALPTAILSIGTDEYETLIPESATRRYLQYETRDAAGNPHQVRRFQIDPPPITQADDFDDEEIAVRKLKAAVQDYRMSNPVAFSPVDYNTVQWDAFELRTATQTHNIVAGDTGNMTGTAMRYIYFDPALSTTVLQVSTVLADSQGDDKVFLCMARPKTDVNQDAFFLPAVGILGGLGEDILSANLAAFNILAANTVTALLCNIGTLSSITADLGTVTAGTISTNVLVAAESFTAANATFSGVLKIRAAYGSNLFTFTAEGLLGNARLELRSNSDGTLSAIVAGGGIMDLRSGGNGVYVDSVGPISFGAADSGGTGFRQMLVPN